LPEQIFDIFDDDERKNVIHIPECILHMIQLLVSLLGLFHFEDKGAMIIRNVDNPLPVNKA
jgi:hypothetical protein